MTLSPHRPRSTHGRASAVFELLAVVSLSGLVSTALIPLLGNSVEVERLQRTLTPSKLESYLFAMEAAGLGLEADRLTPILPVFGTQKAESSN